MGELINPSVVLFDYSLRTGNLILKIERTRSGCLFQCLQSNIYSDQRLSNIVMQLVTHSPSFILLRHETRVGQSTQFLLQTTQFRQDNHVSVPAVPEGLLHPFPQNCVLLEGPS